MEIVRVSDLFGLGISQAGLDFVDVNVNGDVPADIDPFAIRTQAGLWFEQCVGFLQSYFESLLEAIKDNDEPRISELVVPTSEPNETHLGRSKGRASGRGFGDGKKSQNLVEQLATSRAIRSGLLSDLEDTAFLIPGIGPDTISDITTSVIRKPLLFYTQQQCELHSIPMASFPSGPIWNPDTRNWQDQYEYLPEASGGKLLLVPKSIVRLRPILNHEKYYRGYLRDALIEDEKKNLSSALIKTINGERKPVSMGDFDKAMGTSKENVARNAEKHLETLTKYKDDQKKHPHPGLTQHLLERASPSGSVEDIDYIEAYEAVQAVQPGNAGATAFHTSVAKLLSAIFEGALGNQKLEYALHQGRKRVDITMDNYASDGFFRWLSLHYKCPTVFIECKNYSRDPANESIDQIAGRFSRDRGEVGILVCRELSDRKKILERCRDTAKDGRGYIMVLDDNDLKLLAEEANKVKLSNIKEREINPNADPKSMTYNLLDDQFKKLIG